MCLKLGASETEIYLKDPGLRFENFLISDGQILLPRLPKLCCIGTKGRYHATEARPRDFETGCHPVSNSLERVIELPSTSSGYYSKTVP
jgi:hypothetical protein